jgi:hypothetical protein
MKDDENYKLSPIAFCSILIKYKYVSIQAQYFKKNPEYYQTAKKIYENLIQFGDVSKNPNFREYMKEFLTGPDLVNNSNFKELKQNPLSDLSSNKVINKTKITDQINLNQSPQVNKNIFEIDEKDKALNNKDTQNIASPVREIKDQKVYYDYNFYFIFIV